MSALLPHLHLDHETLGFDFDLLLAAGALCVALVGLFLPGPIQLAVLLTGAVGWLVYQMASGDSAA